MLPAFGRGLPVFRPDPALIAGAIAPARPKVRR